MARAIDRLLERLEKMGEGEWIPAWLTAVGTRGEIEEWRSISHAYRGLDRIDRMKEFIKKIREKHPDMPVTLEEEIEARVRELEADPELRRREGITEEMEKDWQD